MRKFSYPKKKTRMKNFPGSGQFTVKVCTLKYYSCFKGVCCMQVAAAVGNMLNLFILFCNNITLWVSFFKPVWLLHMNEYVLLLIWHSFDLPILWNQPSFWRFIYISHDLNLFSNVIGLFNWNNKHAIQYKNYGFWIIISH